VAGDGLTSETAARNLIPRRSGWSLERPERQGLLYLCFSLSNGTNAGNIL
jgi:hypothetical protein